MTYGDYRGGGYVEDAHFSSQTGNDEMARYPSTTRNTTGGPCRNRTCDLGIKSPLLYLLS